MASREVIEATIVDCEDACAALAQRLSDQLETAGKSVLIAMKLAEHAHRGGHEQLARRRQRLVDWTRELEAILASI